MSTEFQNIEESLRERIEGERVALKKPSLVKLKAIECVSKKADSSCKGVRNEHEAGKIWCNQKQEFIASTFIVSTLPSSCAYVQNALERK